MNKDTDMKFLVVYCVQDIDSQKTDEKQVVATTLSRFAAKRIVEAFEQAEKLEPWERYEVVELT